MNSPGPSGALDGLPGLLRQAQKTLKALELLLDEARKALAAERAERAS